MADLNVLYLLNFVLKCPTTDDLTAEQIWCAFSRFTVVSRTAAGIAVKMHIYMRTEIPWDIMQRVVVIS
jgi:hypothetical protein